MCRLKLISKRNSAIVSDRQVKLGDKEFNLLDKPYYVVESSEENRVVYTFHYMDKGEQQRKVSDDYFALFYGVLTGRIYTLIVKSPQGSHVSNEHWETFRREILQTGFDFDLAKSNLRLGFGVIKKLYFLQYEVVE